MDQAYRALEETVRRICGQPDSMEQFTELFHYRELDKGGFFVHAGDMPRNVAFVAEGVARMFYVRSDGKEFTKTFTVAPDFMSSLEALLTHSQSRLSIQALTPVRMLVATYSDLVDLYDRDIFWQRLGRTLIERTYIKKAQREASLLMDSATVRYQQFLARYPGLAARIPAYHVASYLGITAEALSRLKKMPAP